MRSRIFLLLTLVLFVFVAWTFAEPIVEKPFDVEKVEWLWTAAFGGIGVLAFTEIVKRFIRKLGVSLNAVGAVIVSIAVSMGAVAYYFVFQLKSFNIGYFVLYSALLALAANGLYKWPKFNSKTS